MVKKDAPVSAFRTDADAAVKETPPGTPARRSWFYDVTAFLLGGLVAMLPVGLGLRTFLDPWRRQPRIPKGYDRGAAAGDREGFIRITSLAAIVEGAAPQR